MFNSQNGVFLEEYCILRVDQNVQLSECSIPRGILHFSRENRLPTLHVLQAPECTVRAVNVQGEKKFRGGLVGNRWGNGKRGNGKNGAV